MSSDAKLGFGAAAGALLFYGLLDLGVGWGALDNDTPSLALTWKLFRDGVIVNGWPLTTPKFLPVTLDGLLNELGGLDLVLARALATGAALVGFLALLARRLAGPWAAAAATGFALLNREIAGHVLQGNSTILFVVILLAAAYVLLKQGWGWAAAALLFASATARTEGLVYLAAGSGLFFLIEVRRNRVRAVQIAALAAVLAAASAGLDCWYPTQLSGRFRTTFEITSGHTQALLRQYEVARGQTNELEPSLAEYSGLEEAYWSNAAYLLGRVARPGPAYLLLAAVGLWSLRRRRDGLILLAALGLPPLIYCGYLHANTVVLTNRYFFPTIFALILAAAAGAGWAAERLRASKRLPQTIFAGVLLTAAGLSAVGARDVYRARIGYLQAVSEDRASFRNGLQSISPEKLAEARIVTAGAQWPLTFLASRADFSRASRQNDFVLGPRSFDDLADCDYLLLEKDGRIERRFECATPSTCTLSAAGTLFRSFWISESGRQVFFERASGL